MRYIDLKVLFSSLSFIISSSRKCFISINSGNCITNYTFMNMYSYGSITCGMQKEVFRVSEYSSSTIICIFMTMILENSQLLHIKICICEICGGVQYISGRRKIQDVIEEKQPFSSIFYVIAWTGHLDRHRPFHVWVN